MRFVSAIGASAFMHELLGVVAYEARELGIDTTVSEGALPTYEEGDVYVVIPHEYFVVTPQSQHPTAEQLARTIGFCVEHPGNVSFEMSVHWARRVARAVDINDDSTAALWARGIPAERFTLGYSSAWDVWHGDDRPRDVDVCYLGTTDPRRSRALIEYAERLGPRSVQLLMPPHEPMTKTRPDFLMGREKLELLSRAKVLLNLHRGASVSIEWVRILEAMCNGCVVVSEHSIDSAPLRPGKDIVFGHWRSLGELTDLLLEEPERLESIRRESYRFLKRELTMRPSVSRLVELASDLAGAGVTTREALVRPAVPAVVGVRSSEGEGGTYGEVPSVLEDSAMRGVLARSLALGASEPVPVFPRRTSRGRTSVDVIVVQGAGEPLPWATLASILDDDGRIDLVVRASGRARRDGPSVSDPRLVFEPLEGSTNVGAARNRLLASSDAEYVFVVQPTDTVLSGTIERLVSLLAANPDADASYAMTAEPNGVIGNALPFEPDRLEREDYLGSPVMWRRDSLIELGGWTQEPALATLEDRDLWLRLVAAGGGAVLLPQILVRRRRPSVPVLSRVDVDPEATERLLRSRARSQRRVAAASS
jgi:hypothetical protein